MNSIEWLFQSLWDAPKDKFTWESIRKKAEDMHKQEIMEAKKSIELPSDEEIFVGIIEHCKIPHDRMYAEINAMIDGAKWYREQIKSKVV